MCEHCKSMKNSDGVPSVCLDEITGQIAGRKVSALMEMDCYASGETGEYQISASISAQNIFWETILKIDIKYCPFCGRKLVEVN